MRNDASKASQSTTNTVGIYLQEIGRISLLTPEQEFFFAQQVRQMVTILATKQKLTVEKKRTPTLAEWASEMQMSEQELLEQLDIGKQVDSSGNYPSDRRARTCNPLTD